LKQIQEQETNMNNHEARALLHLTEAESGSMDQILMAHKRETQTLRKKAAIAGDEILRQKYEHGLELADQAMAELLRFLHQGEPSSTNEEDLPVVEPLVQEAPSARKASGPPEPRRNPSADSESAKSETVPNPRPQKDKASKDPGGMVLDRRKDRIALLLDLLPPVAALLLYFDDLLVVTLLMFLPRLYAGTRGGDAARHGVFRLLPPILFILWFLFIELAYS